MHTHSPACAHRPCPGRARVPYCGAPSRLCRVVSQAPTPCSKPPAGRVVGAVAVSRPSAARTSGRVMAWLAVSQDTPRLARLPMSQYTIVYCNTKKPVANLPLCHNTTRVLQYTSSHCTPKATMSRYNGVLQYTHKPFKPPKTWCVTIQFLIVLSHGWAVA